MLSKEDEGLYGVIEVHESGKAYLVQEGERVFEVRGGIDRGFWEVFGRFNEEEGGGTVWKEEGRLQGNIRFEPCLEEQF